MHTIWVRLNAVVFFGLSVLLGLSCLAALSKIGHASRHQPGECLYSTLFLDILYVSFTLFSTVVKTLKLNTLRSLKSHGGVDRCLLSFDITADLTPAFHWNIKQLFVYVVASYSTPTCPNNQIVLWDKIIESQDVKIIDEQNVFVKYALVDQADQLRGKHVQLKLMWDHMPITGLLYMGEQDPSTTSNFTLPTEYQ
jgi:signal peptidase complex subunit 3